MSQFEKNPEQDVLWSEQETAFMMGDVEGASVSVYDRAS